MPIKGEKICPRCNTPFEQRDGEKCPSCGALLKFQRGKRDGVYMFWYEVADETMAKVLPSSPEPEKSSNGPGYPRKISDEGESPSIVQTGPESYEVTYQAVAIRTMMYCPKCSRPAFQVNFLKGDLEHQCTAFIKDINGKCLTKTTYIFLNEQLRYK